MIEAQDYTYMKTLNTFSSSGSWLMAMDAVDAR